MSYIISSTHILVLLSLKENCPPVKGATLFVASCVGDCCVWVVLFDKCPTRDEQCRELSMVAGDMPQLLPSQVPFDVRGFLCLWPLAVPLAGLSGLVFRIIVG